MNIHQSYTKCLVALLLTALSITAGTAYAAGPAAVNLGTAGNYVILAKSAVSTTGTTSVVGDIGISPAAASYITGFSLTLDSTGQFSTSPLVTGRLYAADYNTNAPNPTSANLTTAVSDMQTAYTDAAGRSLPDFTELGAGNISGMTLAPGLYKWGTGLMISSVGVTLSGGPNDVWIFQIAQTLTVANGAIVTLSGGAQAKNIFWQTGGQATLGTTSDFKGIILSQTAIVLQTGAVLNGRALAQTAVSLNANSVVAPASGSTGGTTTTTSTSTTSSSTTSTSAANTTTTSTSTTTSTTLPPSTSITLSGSAPITAGIGSTVTVPAGNTAIGALITLPPAPAGTATQAPVTVVIGGQSLTMVSGSANAVVKVNTVTINGVATTVLQPTAGTVTVTATGAFQPLFAVGNGVVIADSANTTAVSSLNATTGNTNVVVTQGSVTLSAATAAGGKIYAGENVVVNAAGTVTGITLGSASGAGSAGDPLVIANQPANLVNSVIIPNLKGSVARLGGGTQNLEQMILTVAPGISLGSGGQSASGAIPITAGNLKAYIQPVGSVVIDATKPDGISINDDGMIQLVKSGVVVSFAPTVPDTRQFATDSGTAVTGATTRVSANGAIVASVGGSQYVLQPGLAVTPGVASGTAGFELDSRSRLVYRDSNGGRQTLYPMFMDTKTLGNVLKANLGAGTSVATDFAGSVSVRAGGVQAFTLTPDYLLTNVPTAQTGKTWWSDAATGKLFIVNADGTAQGFTAK
ncbi:MAG: ice-binding family protein [Proteobacteria bacterium]|nr:ice-binding family protein [Pseudomonadota bacterium]